MVRLIEHLFPHVIPYLLFFYLKEILTQIQIMVAHAGANSSGEIWSDLTNKLKWNKQSHGEVADNAIAET